VDDGSVSNSHRPSSEGTFRIDTPKRNPIARWIEAYAVSITECVNAADDFLYKAFEQQPPPGATDLMQAALQTITECQNLKRRLTADHDEQIAAVDEKNRDDLSAVANAAGQQEWESKFEQADSTHGIDIR
jgi:hypothetical protein